MFDARRERRYAAGLLAIGNVLFWAGLVLWLPCALFLNLLWGWGELTRPTLAMHAFLAVGTLWLPALATVGVATASGSARFVKAAALVALGTVALVASAALSVAVFPDYPRRGPHELVAVAMVFPAILLPLGMMAFWKRLKVSRAASIYCGAWALVLLGATTFVFERELDMRLPLTADVWRWERNDIQDYSNYYLRADRVTAEDAASYAKAIGLTQRRGSLGCSAQTPELEPASGWAPPQHDIVWDRDERKLQQDRDRYPDGLAGCFTRMAWAADSIYLCEICDFGI